jgi:DNA invertase Pin-like site-specific DNA recombinase
MITDGMQNQFEVILIYHSSRFARNVSEARHYKELLREKLKIDVLSVTQHFGNSWDDPSFYLNEGINELFDGYYSKQLGFWVKKSLLEKRTQGYQTGNVPFGYYKKRVGFDSVKNRPIYDPTWRIHPQESKILKRIYTMYASCKYSLANIAQILNSEGLRTKAGYQFTYSGLREMIGNKVYLGKVYSKRRGYPTLKGAHPPIISQALFEKAVLALSERRNTSGRPVAQHRFYLLQNLVYCHKSRAYLKGKEDKPRGRLTPKMYSETHQWKYPVNKKHERKFYCCKIRRENKSCSQPDVATHYIDGQVLQFMSGLKLPSPVIEKVIQKLQQMFKQASATKKDANFIDRLLLKKKKLDFTWNNTDELTESDYLAKLENINAELRKYESLGMINDNDRLKPAEHVRKTEKFLKEFNKFWLDNMDDKERREWLLITIKRIWVEDKSVVAVEPAEEFKLLFSFLRKLIGQSPLGTP